jgi:hypothetical protein
MSAVSNLVTEVLELSYNGISPEEISAVMGLSLDRVLNIIEQYSTV